MCEGDPPSTVQPLPSARTCVLDVHEDFLELSNSSSALALGHLYIRLKTRDTARASSTFFLQKVPRLWMTDMVLEGDGEVVRGVDADENTRLYMESAISSSVVCKYLQHHRRSRPLWGAESSRTVAPNP